MKTIRFIALGCCSELGNFGPSDIARVSDALAQHLVEQARVAEYVEQQADKTEQPTTPKRRHKQGA